MPHSRYIPHANPLPSDLSQVCEDITNALKTGVQRVRRHPSSKTGVYIGAGGHLLTRWRLADTLPQSDLPTIHADAGTLPLSIPSTASRASFLETAVGSACLVLAQQLRTHERDKPAAKFADAAKAVRAAVRLGVQEPARDEDGCEVLYGRAGLLYGLLFLRRAMARRHVGGSDAAAHAATAADGPDACSLVAPLVSDENLGALVGDIVARGRIGAAAYSREAHSCPPLMWSWHGKRYLGGAHAGILQILLCSPTHLVAPHWAAIEGTVDWLLGLQQPSGNWPHKATPRTAAEEPDDGDQLIQWCHGAPGVLVLLATLLRRGTVKDETKQAARVALAKGGRLVYERGLLRKGVGLCHGVGGNVYALLAVSEVLDDASQPRGESEWFRCALHLAHLACAYEGLTARGEMGTPDRPYSLYEGVAGMCCAWADVLALLSGTRRRAGMPGFDDLDNV